MRGSRINALAVLAEVASWDRGEDGDAVDMCWIEEGPSLIERSS